ncbi:MAG TPA: hypothetical protein VE869_02765 [Gemmatimonas sp.]|nr:hypothetical protein [Gemmatimonas sp.]
MTARMETTREPLPTELLREVRVESADAPSPVQLLQNDGLTVEQAAAAPDQAMDDATSVRTIAARVVDAAFIMIYSLLGVRLLTALLSVRSDAGPGRVVASVTDPLYAPFHGVVANPLDAGGSILALPVLIALTSYMLLHVVINAALRIMLHKTRGISTASRSRTAPPMV